MNDTIKPLQTHKKRTWKRRVAKYSAILLFIFLLCFTILFFVSKFFDTYRMGFQNPIIFALRTPIMITKRLVYREAPKAQYISVNPFTSPAEIDRVIKNHDSFEYIQSPALEKISKETIKALIKNKVVQKWGAESWKDVEYILNNESGFDPYIVNKSSGACGIFQALPCSKLPSLDITDQINWGIKYIEQRYKTPANAYDFKKEKGWY